MRRQKGRGQLLSPASKSRKKETEHGTYRQDPHSPDCRLLWVVRGVRHGRGGAWTGVAAPGRAYRQHAEPDQRGLYRGGGRVPARLAGGWEAVRPAARAPGAGRGAGLDGRHGGSDPSRGELVASDAPLLFFGVAQGIVEVGGNALLLWVHTDHAGPFMNALHFFFGVGALLAPVGVALATSAAGGVAWFFGSLPCWCCRWRAGWWRCPARSNTAGGLTGGLGSRAKGSTVPTSRPAPAQCWWR